MTHMEAAQELFAQLGWNARVLQDYPVLSCAVAVPNGTLEVFCHVHADAQRVLFYVRPQGLEIRTDLLPELAEFLTRANYGLPLVNFEMDWDDPEVNGKSGVQVPVEWVSPEFLKAYLLAAVETVNHYLPGLQAVLQGQKPALAIRSLDVTAPPES